MPLYNTLFGRSPLCDALLQMLGASEDRIPRFRDCFLSKDGSEIVIHTRTGGGNRETYDAPSDKNPDGPWNSDLRELPGYKRDEDMQTDTTYANFYYEIPEGFKALVKHLIEITGDEHCVDPEERWRKLFADLKKGNQSPEANQAKQVGENIAAALKSGKRIIEI